jgi:hypothetical protein
MLLWLSAPALFAAAVLGLTGFGAVLLDADWRASLSTMVFGPAAGITALLSAAVEWPARWQRWWIGLGYPAVVFVAGLVLAGVSLSPPLAMLIGTPALITLVVLIARERNKVIPIA